jgi:phosphoribosyl 1,2-cyclic phosphodiesterase
VSHDTSSVSALTKIIQQQPDCVLLDIMMPEMDGLEVLKRLRSKPALNATRIVIVSGKSYEFDRKRAYGFGADSYITKPVDPQKSITQLDWIIKDWIKLTFWGVHGTLPAPSKQTTKYGGNTSCVTLEFSRNNLFIFDAGTGIKLLSDHLLHEKRPLPKAMIFISHPHWDHINALPFFAPLYQQGNEIDICGPSQGDVSMREMISGQMDGVYFPIKIKEFSAALSFRELKEEVIDTDGIKIKTMLLNHPGHCLGYRVEYKDRSICYITDNELHPESSPYYNQFYVDNLENFIKEADALIIDATYQDDEYESKIGWGHSAISQVVDLAHRARVMNLYLFHHDLDQTDADIDAKLKSAKTLLTRHNSQTQVIAPKEKQTFKI